MMWCEFSCCVIDNCFPPFSAAARDVRDASGILQLHKAIASLQPVHAKKKKKTYSQAVLAVNIWSLFLQSEQGNFVLFCP